MTDAVETTTATRPRRNAAPLADGVWPTRAARMTLDAIEACRAAGQLGLVTGPSGIGKTTAARAAVRLATENDRHARLVRMTTASAGLQPGLVRIGGAVEAHVNLGMGAAEAQDAIVRAVAYWGRWDVLVLDEAQAMGDDLLAAVRDIYDERHEGGRGPGIVLLGDADLAARVNGRTGRQARRFEPMRGRLGVAVELPAPDASDFRMIADAQGVAEPAAADLVARVGAGRGGLHNVARLIATARDLAGPGVPLTLGVLRTAAQVAGIVP